MRTTSERILIIGIDCATQAGKIGLARGRLEGGALSLDALAPRTTKMAAIEQTITGWIEDAQSPTKLLLALDAPLGWPAAMTDALSDHRAGLPLGTLEADPNLLFRRTTDRRIKIELGQNPLDVGADRIARTAHGALAMLGRLRTSTGLALPLAWSPGAVSENSVIEVYPAATLRSRGWPHAGYKNATDASRALRKTICAALSKEVAFNVAARKSMLDSDHVLDAALCVLAGADFARGEVIVPNAGDLPRREGWIWVRPPGPGVGSKSAS